MRTTFTSGRWLWFLPVLLLGACGSSGGNGGNGGNGGGNGSDAGSLLTPTAPGWEALRQMPAALGGQLPGNTVYKTVSRFDPGTGHWETLADTPIELTGHRAVAVGSAIYVLGGFRTQNGVRQGFSGVPYMWKYTPP